jgi:hypothetical protein
MPNKNWAELFGCLGHRDWTSMCGIDATGTVIEENDRKRPRTFWSPEESFQLERAARNDNCFVSDGWRLVYCCCDPH